MSHSFRRIALGTSVLALSLAGSLGTAAATPTGATGWNGHCYTISRTTTSFTGWCDGTGPERYGTYVVCTSGEYHSSYTKWYGDRTGVYAGCPSGKTRISDGYDRY